MKESLKDYIRLLSINYVEFIKKSNQVTFYVGFIKKLGRFVSVMNFSSIYEF